MCKSSVSDSQRTLQRTEFLILEVVVGDHCLLLAVYYNPPDVDCADILEKHITDYSLHYSSTFLIGDFNTDPRKHTGRAVRLNDVFANMSYDVVNHEPTFFFNSGSSLLDLLITDSATSVLRFNQISMPGISKHDLIFASLDFDRDSQQAGFWCRDYYNYDANALHSEFKNFDWNSFLQIDDPDVLLSVLNPRLTDLHERFFPMKFKKFKKNPWYSRDIEKAMIDRDLAYRIWKRTRSSQHRADYNHLRNRVNGLISKCDYDSRRLNLTLPSKQR